MASFDKYKDIDTEEEYGALFLRGRMYTLPTGTKAKVLQTSAWCYQCRSVVAAEHISSDSEIASQRELLLQLINGQENYLSSFFKDIDAVRAELDQQEQLWDALAKRNVGPRCLHCFGTRIFPLSCEFNEVVCIPDGPRLKYETSGFADIGLEPVLNLDTEGNKLG